VDNLQKELDRDKRKSLRLLVAPVPGVGAGTPTPWNRRIRLSSERFFRAARQQCGAAISAQIRFGTRKARKKKPPEGGSFSGSRYEPRSLSTDARESD
jgi:hypothetical protein